MNKLEKYWERYRKEKKIPKKIFPQFPNVRYRWQLTKRQKRILSFFDGYRAYREHITEHFCDVPQSYDKFKKEMKFFYGWDFSTKHGD